MTMEEFFIQCLKDLEPLTGHRQLYFLQSDLEDGERQKNVLIKGMVLAAAEYPYIPEEAQQKIISDQMVKDQTYDRLNSRMVHKWLSGVSGKYFRESSHQNPLSEQELTPAPPQELSLETKKLIQSYLADLAGAKAVPAMSRKEIELLGQEQKDPTPRGSVSRGRKSNPALVHQAARLEEVTRQLGYDKITELSKFKKFDVEGRVIVAMSEVDAMFIHSEVYQQQTP